MGQECDIDELLQHAAHKRTPSETPGQNSQGLGMHSFTRKTFESDKAKDTASLDVTGKNFWSDLWKIRQKKAANADGNEKDSKTDPDSLYLDNYLLDDKTRCERLLTSL